MRFWLPSSGAISSYCLLNLEFVRRKLKSTKWTSIPPTHTPFHSIRSRVEDRPTQIIIMDVPRVIQMKGNCYPTTRKATARLWTMYTFDEDRKIISDWFHVIDNSLFRMKVGSFNCCSQCYKFICILCHTQCLIQNVMLMWWCDDDDNKKVHIALNFYLSLHSVGWSRLCNDGIVFVKIHRWCIITSIQGALFNGQVKWDQYASS